LQGIAVLDNQQERKQLTKIISRGKDNQYNEIGGGISINDKVE